MSDIKVYVPNKELFTPVRLLKEQRIRRPHDCERCGHHMEWDDQQCGCSARDPWLNR